MGPRERNSQLSLRRDELLVFAIKTPNGSGTPEQRFIPIQRKLLVLNCRTRYPTDVVTLITMSLCVCTLRIDKSNSSSKTKLVGYRPLRYLESVTGHRT